MIPGLVVLRGYQRSWLRGDLIAGVTVTASLIPQVMAYAVVAGVRPVAVDFTALEAHDALREEITRRGAVFALARVKQDLLARLQSFGLAQKIGAERLFPTLPTAVEAYDTWAGQLPPPSSQDGGPDS